MAKIEAEKKEFKKIFSDFWFEIPDYQRSYVWEKDQVCELLDDLWYAFENKENDEYFLGSLVLKKKDNSIISEFEVLDGQQRLTTLFLLLAVIRDSATNKELVDSCKSFVYQEANVFKKIPSKAKLVYKIRDNVMDFFNKYIIALNGTTNNDLGKLSDEKNISISNMSKNILHIKSFLSSQEKMQNLDSFAVFLFNNVVFIYVSTDNFEDAYRLFSILNDRGIPLTNSDILKSKNIGAIKDTDRTKYATIWETIENELGSDDFNRFLAYIRTILVKEKARKNLLNEFDEHIYSKNLLKEGKETIELIREYYKVYNKAIEFEDTTLVNQYYNLVYAMKFLPSTDWIPPLLHFYKKFKSDNVLEFLKKLEFKFSGDWITQLSPTDRIDNMNKIIKQIDATNKSSELIQDDRLFDVDVASLKQSLNGNVYGRRFARYILLKLEYLFADNTVRWSNYNNLSVEHVLPQTPSENSQWKKNFDDSAREDWTDKLANLILLSKNKNSQLSNLDFTDKKEKYFAGRISGLPRSSEILNYSAWTVELLEKRQNTILDKLTNLSR